MSRKLWLIAPRIASPARSIAITPERPLRSGDESATQFLVERDSALVERVNARRWRLADG
jgi:hypothetical protein